MQHRQHAEEQGPLGFLCPGQKKLEGKTFYLDSVKKRPTALLLEAIALLGGGVESFLHKDVSFVVTGNQEGLEGQKSTYSKAGAKGTNQGTQCSKMAPESVLSKDKRRPATPRPMACGSRGKALLEKAIRNNERLQGSSVLANARLWGVKVLYADDVLLYLKQLTRESFSVTQKKPERTYTKQQGCPLVKAAALRSPYLKIEDFSRKYKPLHMQSMTFPSLWYSGRFSPFESPPPLFEKRTEQGEIKREKKKVDGSIQDKSQTPLSCNPSPWRPRKKDLSYCECCHQPFTNLEEHLQSDRHRAFVLDLSNYSVIDQLVAEMVPRFDPCPSKPSDETLNRAPTPLHFQDVCELEPLTDAETEHAVQALQRQGASFSVHISSPTRGHLYAPLSLAPGVPFPTPNPAAPPADTQPFATSVDRQLPKSHPQSLVMPVLDVEPQARPPCPSPSPPCPSPSPPCPSLDTPCPSSDPYSLPPVLSPQVFDSSNTTEPRCLYSDPPVLSPQWYAAEEPLEGHTCEMDTAESVSRSVSDNTTFVPTPLPPSVALTNAEGTSCASPQRSTVLQNPKKRCRSASLQHSHRKKRRITGKCTYSGSWTEEGHMSSKSDNEAKPEDILLFDKVSHSLISQSFPNPTVSSTCTGETHASKQTFAVFCVPTAQNFTRAPNPLDILGHGATSVGEHPSWPCSSKAKTFDPPLRLPAEKSTAVFSSQDSQRSLSHSTSVCIESALIPDLATFSMSSTESDWDCDLSGPTSAAFPLPAEQACELDKELLHRPCAWVHDSSYESRLHTVLQPSTPAASLCGEEMDPSSFSRTVVQIVEVQH